MAGPRRPIAPGSAAVPSSSERDPFDDQTTVEPEPSGPVKDRWEEKTKAERGVAHIIRRPLVPKRRPDTNTSVPEDSGEILLTPPSHGLPAVPSPSGKDRFRNERTGTLDELTVEDHARPLPPLSLVRGDSTGDPSTGAAGQSAATLVVTAGNDRGRSFSLTKTSTAVGRGVDNDIVLTDISVSRHHLAIEFDGQGYWLRDLGSGNGTLLNDREHDGRVRLHHGDRLELGNTVVQFSGGPGAAVGAAPQPWSDAGVDEPGTLARRRPGNRAREALPLQERAADPPVPPAPPPAPRAASLAERDRIEEAAMAAVTAAEESGVVVPVAPGYPPLAPGSLPVPAMPPTPSPPSPYNTAPSQHSGPYPLAHPTLSASRPGVAGAQRAADRGKLLVGIIAVAMVLVGIGIVAAVVGGKTAKQEGALAAGEGEPASAAEATSPDEAAPEVEAAPADDTAAEDEAAPEVEAAPAAAADDEDAPEDEAAPAEDTPGGSAVRVVRLASLSTGTRTLAASAWGTDEAFLRDLPDAPPARDDSAEDDSAGDDGPEAPAEEAPAPTPPPQRAAPDRTPKRATAKRPPARRSPPRRSEPKRATVNTGAVKSAALSLYAQQKFTEAADQLRAAADDLDGRAAAQLTDLAAGMGQVGNLLAAGERTSRTDAPAALKAYKRAVTRDRKVSGGKLATLLRLRIGQVAPRAARTHMAKKNYAEARRAAEDAVRYGAAGEVSAVLSSLERSAARDVEKAEKLAKSGDTGKARQLLQEVRRYAPTSSSAHADARRLLKEL